MPDLPDKLASAKEVPLTMWESTLILGGRSVAERGRQPGLVAGYVIVPAPVPPRQTVSIADFERAMRALKGTGQ